MEEANEPVFCHCGVPARMGISTTERNPGRRFHTCSNRSNQCQFFAWIDRDMPVYPMLTIKGLRTELNVMTDERNAALLQLGEARGLFLGLKDSHEMYVEENQILKEESGLLMGEIDTLKDYIKVLEVKCEDMKKSVKVMKIGFGVGAAVAGCSLALVCLRRK